MCFGCFSVSAFKDSWLPLSFFTLDKDVRVGSSLATWVGTWIKATKAGKETRSFGWKTRPMRNFQQAQRRIWELHLAWLVSNRRVFKNNPWIWFWKNGIRIPWNAAHAFRYALLGSIILCRKCILKYSNKWTFSLLTRRFSFWKLKNLENAASIMSVHSF